ncbi:MAG: YhcH/YjgK/YiaL family protein [Lachnospiraceae bacterium]|nr:YhcH/YjgK/YiaL family protein [Lachnospiraceae bacterium]
MVYDKLENLKEYISEADYELIDSKFFKIINPDMEEGEYKIDGDRIYAKVMSYDTKEAKDCKLETHNAYRDIQGTISGVEGIDIYKRSELQAETAYNADNDVTFYSRNEEAHMMRINDLPGYFSLIGTEEAHCAQIRVGNIKRVKKFVIKYRI